MSNELKPCPFCGEKPELPAGDGTHYEIECDGCGQAMASVQICDLMTIEERASEEFTNYRYAEEFVERAKAEAIANWNRRAQPAEANGVEVVGYVNPSDIARELPNFDVKREKRPHYCEPVMFVSDHLAALSAVTAERDALLRDAERYRWLRHRLVGASFDWDDEGMAVLAFEMPDGVSIGADCDKNIDAAMASKEGV